MKQFLSKHETILRTGSTGCVCRHLVSSLLSCTNFNIVVTYNDKTGIYEDNSRLFFEKADLLKPDSFEYIFTNYKPKHIFHLAAMARVSDGENDPVKVITANFLTTIKLAKLSLKYRAGSMVFTSSNLAQDAVSVVGIGKFLVEQYFHKINLQTTKFIS